MNHRSSHLVFWLLALCLLSSLAGCRKKETEATITGDPGALEVATLEVQARPFVATVPVTGTLVSRATVTVKAETTGRLLKFIKQEGDTVTAGEAVAWVDDENYRLTVRQDQTAIQVAEAALARTRVAAEHTTSELERARNLLKSGGITDRDLKSAEVAQRDAAAQVALAEAQLAQARAVLEAAEKRLRDTVIRAPIGGVIEQRFVNPGAYVEAPTPMFTIVDNQRLELESPVPSADLAQVRQGQRVTFEVNSYPGTVFEGSVIEMNPALDPATRSARVRIAVNNAGSRLRAGMFAQGQVLTGVEQRAIVVPAAAVYRSAGTASDAYAFVAENGKAVRRAVDVGRETNGQLEIRGGLKAGDRLIAERRVELADGVHVAPGK
ncbi:MAG: efflux RND transporter periplasmic adaptor subunit [Bryobacterales bacterium]|nr:efflux RND transporter periplasmic adaptor subunit [Bryobacterales bacterium]